MKLLLFDLDGTLLDNEKNISKRTLAVLHACREKGILIGVSTSRGEQNSLTFLDELQPDILISSGGALVKKENTYIYKAEISPQETHQMIEAARKICGDDCEITVDTVTSHYWNYKIDPKTQDKTWGDSIYTDFADFNQPALKVCVEIFDSQKAEDLKATLSDYDCIRFSDGFWYKFTKSGITKEKAIHIICDACNIGLADITAFGDDFADIGMLKLCGVGVAMGNAIDEVKEIADIVIGRNDEDGIAEYVEKEVLTADQKKAVLTIHVAIHDWMDVQGESTSVCMLCFDGTAESPYFTGKILPGGVDTQKYSKGKQGHLSARYMLEGQDLTGAACRIFIENNGARTDGEMVTTPRIVTDSKALSWLEDVELEGTIIDEADGVRIDIYEKISEIEREPFSFSKGEKTIYGEICKPVHTEGMMPVVIVSHGYNSCCEYMRHTTELLAQRGIASYCYDFCGGGTNTKSTGKTTEMSICTEQDDLRDVLEQVQQMPWVDTEKIYLMGESQGGFVTGLTAPEFGASIQGLFLIYPAFCIPDHWLDKKKDPTINELTVMGMTIGRRFIEDVPEYDVFAHAANYEGEVYIFHGEKDPLVDVRYSQKLVSAYKNATLLVCPNQEHWFEENYLVAVTGKVAAVIHKK
ncbi:MAG: Cof-type HAD-IIB family hydrolase [Lachnospiraceae bacterium]|nr:Cof-type HAD-IIB family hydrolase [Lachnospiraceae bacterium]